MASGLPPPPVNDKPGSFTWMEWYRQLRNYVATSGSIPWYIINFSGSKLTDIASRNHNQLQSLQGGSANEMYHLSAAQYSTLGNVPYHNALLGLQGGAPTNDYYHLISTDATKVTTNTYPNIKIGNVSGGNYTDVDTDGYISFKGTSTIWDDLRVEPSIKTTGTNDPTFTKWFDNGSGSRGVFLWNFTYANTASEKEVFFSVQLPHSWKGTIIYPHVHWIPSVAGVAQRPVFGMEYNWADIGSALGNTSIIYTNNLVPNDANLTQYRHYVSSFPGITPTTSQDEISSILMCRLFRYSGNASDTYTGTCGLLYIDFHYEMDSLGSHTDFIK